VLLKVKILLFMAISSVRRKRSLRNSLGIRFLYCSNQLFNACRHVVVSMLVYIDDASTVKSLALGGSISSFSSFSSSVEIFI